jgi:hypothetical protein
LGLVWRETGAVRNARPSRGQAAPTRKRAQWDKLRSYLANENSAGRIGGAFDRSIGRSRWRRREHTIRTQRPLKILRVSLRELFYERTSKKQEATQLGLPSFGLLAAKCHTRGSRFRDQSVLLVGYGALDVADRVAPPHDRSFRFELCLPDRAKEIDFQFHGSKGFIWGESTCKRNAHRGISNIAKNSAVQRSHGIGMLWSDCQDDRRPPVSDVFHLKSNQPRDWNVVRLCSFPEVCLRGNFLSTHDWWAPAFDFRARTFVSRYPSK